MKKTIMIMMFLPSAMLFFLAAAALAQENRAIPWGTTMSDFKKDQAGKGEFIEFTPRDNPDYKNKIMSYITAIDEKLISEIVIIRQRGIPEKDFLFVKGKLCTTLEDWNMIDEDRQAGIMNELKRQYGEPSIQKEENFYINSFKSPGTNVLFYMLKQPDGKAKCKVYYYTSKLFRMLILDN